MLARMRSRAVLSGSRKQVHKFPPITQRGLGCNQQKAPRVRTTVARGRRGAPQPLDQAPRHQALKGRQKTVVANVRSDHLESHQDVPRSFRPVLLTG